MELKLQWRILQLPCKELLIVPYGIETILAYVLLLKSNSFNRTLWN